MHEIQAKKRYIKTLPSVPKDEKKAASLKQNLLVNEGRVFLERSKCLFDINFVNHLYFHPGDGWRGQ